MWGHRSVNHFVVGQKVDVTGRSMGKGFAGAMKRVSGLRASHGVSVSHRSMGATGQCQDPGKVFKGKKMPGHMGDRQVTAQNLEVVALDEERGLIMVKGAVPGAKGGYVTIADAVKRAARGRAVSGGLAERRPAGRWKSRRDVVDDAVVMRSKQRRDTGE